MTLFNDKPYSDAFERFWRDCGKGSKQGAWKRWVKHGLEPHAEFVAACWRLQKQARDLVERVDGFSPHMKDTEGWLNNRGWEDDLRTVRKRVAATVPDEPFATSPEQDLRDQRFAELRRLMRLGSSKSAAAKAINADPKYAALEDKLVEK